MAVGVVLALAAEGCAPSAASPGPAEVKVVPLAGAQLERACVAGAHELCFNARDDNCNGLLDEGCGVHTGLVQFSIAWNEASADVDLNVTDPNGELVSTLRPTEAGLVKERDCPGATDDCHGQNMENVFLDGGKPLLRGTYRVAVRLEKLGGSPGPIEVTLGARIGPKSYAATFLLKRPEQEGVIRFEL